LDKKKYLIINYARCKHEECTNNSIVARVMENLWVFWGIIQFRPLVATIRLGAPGMFSQSPLARCFLYKNLLNIFYFIVYLVQFIIQNQHTHTHNIHINDILYIVSIPAGFNASA